MLENLKRLQAVVKAGGQVAAGAEINALAARNLPRSALSALTLDTLGIANDANPSVAGEWVTAINGLGTVGINDAVLGAMDGAANAVHVTAAELDAAVVHAIANAAVLAADKVKCIKALGAGIAALDNVTAAALAGVLSTAGVDLKASDSAIEATLKALNAAQSGQIVALGGPAMVELVKNLGDNVKHLPDAVLVGLTQAHIQAIALNGAAAQAFVKGLGARVANLDAGRAGDLAVLLSTNAVDLGNPAIEATLKALNAAQSAAIVNLGNAEMVRLVTNLGDNVKHLPNEVISHLTTVHLAAIAADPAARLAFVKGLGARVANLDPINTIPTNLATLLATAGAANLNDPAIEATLKALTPAQSAAIVNLGNAEMVRLVTNLGDNVKHLPNEVISHLTTVHLAAIAVDPAARLAFVKGLGARVANLDPINTIPANLATLLATAGANNLNDPAIEATLKALTPDQSEQIVALGGPAMVELVKNLGDNVKHLPNDVINKLTDAHLAAIAADPAASLAFVKGLVGETARMTPAKNTEFANLLSSVNTNLKGNDASLTSALKALTPTQIAAIPAAQFSQFLTNVGDNIQKLLPAAQKAITAAQASSLDSNAFGALEAKSSDLFKAVVAKKINHESAKAGFHGSVDKVEVDNSNSNRIKLTFKTAEEAKIFNQIFVRDLLGEGSKDIILERTRLDAPLEPFDKRDKAKLARKTLENKINAQDYERSTLSTVARTGIGLFGVLPLIFTGVGRALGVIHNRTPLKHIPLVGQVLSTLATTSFRLSNAVDGGLFVDANRNRIKEVNAEQKQVQSATYKGPVGRVFAKINKGSSIIIGAPLQTIRMTAKIIATPLLAGGEFLKASAAKSHPLNPLKYIFGKPGLGSMLSAVGDAFSEFGDMFDTQSFGRNYVVRTMEAGLNTVRDRAQGDKGGEWMAEKLSGKSLKGDLNLVGCDPDLLTVKVTDKGLKLGDIFGDGGKYIAVATCGTQVDGMKAVKYCGWDADGNVSVKYGIENSNHDMFKLGSSNLGDLQGITEAKLVSAAANFKPIETKMVGMSIGDFQKLMEEGTNRELSSKLTVKSNTVKPQTGAKSQEFVAGDYTIKTLGGKMEFFKGVNGAAQERVSGNANSFDPKLLEVVNGVLSGRIKPTEKPSPSPHSAGAKQVGGAYGLYK